VKPYRVKLDREDDAAELWTVDGDESRQFSVARYSGQPAWPWEVYFSVAEFIREDPLETALNDSIHHALTGVRGVLEVFHEDREKWIVSGRPKGKALAIAANEVLARLGPRLDAELARLGEDAR
jgi:hypothetical protein